MWWAAAIQAGMSLFGASKAKRAGGKAREIANLNADAQMDETREETRRMIKENQQREGYARAVAGASGFSVQKGTSQQGYIDELSAEGRRQVSFAGRAGVRKSNILRRGGQLSYSEGKARALGGIASAVGSFGQAYSKSPWGKT